jgi:hypothetical protein
MTAPASDPFPQKQDSPWWTLVYGLFFFGTFETLSQVVPSAELLAKYMLSYYGVEHPFAFILVGIKLLSAISLTLIFMATYKSIVQYWKSQRQALSPEQVKWQIEDLKTQIALLRDENQQLKAYTDTLKATLEKMS